MSVMDSLNNINLKEPIDSDGLLLSVHKFGGSSLADSQKLARIVNIIKTQTQSNDYIVVSANGNITDLLVEINQGNLIAIEKIVNFFTLLVQSVLRSPDILLDEFLGDIEKIKTSCLSEEEILSYGEVWSAKLLTALLLESDIAAIFIDAREIFRSDAIEKPSYFDKNYFNEGIRQHTYGRFNERAIVTGYIAKNQSGQTVTLGRNGSDYSATLLASFLNAQSVTLWTDVCGIFTADPRIIPNAQPIKQLTFDEAEALASIGTNVLHQKTISPLKANKIPLFVKSSLEPEKSGTVVSFLSEFDKPKSIAIRHNLSEVEIDLEGVSLSTIEQAFHRLFESHVNLFLLQKTQKQARYIIAESQLPLLESILQNFALKMLIVRQKCSVISIVGQGVTNCSKKIDRLSLLISSRKTTPETETASVIASNQLIINVVLLSDKWQTILAKIYDVFFETTNRILHSHDISQELVNRSKHETIELTTEAVN
ncbi:aspartate kinase [Aliikangiella maris]|uniref:Aspartate kinase n=2 Tax=Aliikangiella maris TaxID=3162458 RepID=A0ABV3MHX5_9GAMM